MLQKKVLEDPAEIVHLRAVVKEGCWKSIDNDVERDFVVSISILVYIVFHLKFGYLFYTPSKA